MKLNVFVFRNSTLGCSGNPIFDDHEPDVFAKQLERQVYVSKPEDVQKYTNVSLYFLGVYDDETLRLTPEKDPVMLVDFNQALEDRKVKLAILQKVKELAAEKEEELKKGSKEDGSN